jgi:hypothetical protein
MVSVLVLMISANPEELEELEELEPPRLPAVVPDPPEDELLDEEDPVDEELPDPLPDTASPGVRLESEAIVPLTGAYSLVSLSAVSALCTPACAEYTEAWAEAMLPGEGVEVVVAVEVVLGVELPLEDPVRDALGTTTVTVTLGVFLVTVVDPPFDFVGDLPVGELPVGDLPGWKAAYSTVPVVPE